MQERRERFGTSVAPAGQPVAELPKKEKPFVTKASGARYADTKAGRRKQAKRAAWLKSKKGKGAKCPEGYKPDASGQCVKEINPFDAVIGKGPSDGGPAGAARTEKQSRAATSKPKTKQQLRDQFAAEDAEYEKKAKELVAYE